jgi:4-alpha-glucanotransferase
MPKDINTEFFHPNNAPIYQFVTTLYPRYEYDRGWWQEDRTKTRRFFIIDMLGQWAICAVLL